MKLNKFKQLIREEIQTTLSEISPELFKRAMDVSNKKTQQKRYDNPKVTGNNTRLERMGRIYFRNFIGKELLNGKIIDVKVSNMGGDHDYVLIFVEKPEETGYRRMQTFVVNYRIDKDLFPGEIVNMPMTRRDARILGQIVATINPETRYKDYNMFTISSDINEAFLGMGNDDVVKNLLKMAQEGKLPKSKRDQFNRIYFELPINPATKVTYTITPMNTSTYEMKMFDKGSNMVGKKITATQSALKTLYDAFLKTESGTDLSEGPLKNLALGALTAASLMGSPKASAAGGHKDKIEYNQNIPAERQKEVIKAFMEFLDANHTGPSNDPSNIEMLIQLKEFDQVVNLFMVSDENAEVGTTEAESETLRKNFTKIYKKYLDTYAN
jgi:hypothetical protein